MPTQRSHRFPKHKKSLIFGILTKGGPHEKILETWISEIAESDIFYVKSSADDDSAIENWLRALFVEL